MYELRYFGLNDTGNQFLRAKWREIIQTQDTDSKEYKSGEMRVDRYLVFLPQSNDDKNKLLEASATFGVKFRGVERPSDDYGSTVEVKILEKRKQGGAERYTKNIYPDIKSAVTFLNMLNIVKDLDLQFTADVKDWKQVEVEKKISKHCFGSRNDMWRLEFNELKIRGKLHCSLNLEAKKAVTCYKNLGCEVENFSREGCEMINILQGGYPRLCKWIFSNDCF